MNPTCDAFGRIRYKGVRVLIISFAGIVTDDELFAGSDGQIGVLIAAFHVTFGCPPLADSNPCPQFINLQGAGLDIANQPVMQLLAFLAYGVQDGQHGLMLAAGQSGSGANAHALTEQFDDLNDLFMVNSHSVQRLIFRE